MSDKIENNLYENIGEIKTSLRHIESKVNLISTEIDAHNLRISDLELKRTLDISIAENSERKMKKVMTIFGVIITLIGTCSTLLYRHALNEPTKYQDQVIQTLKDRLNTLEKR